MRVLVTGASGFLGQHVVKELRGRSHQVLSLDRKGGPGLLDAGWTRDMVEDAEADAVIHLAAKCGGIGANMDRPGEFFHDNMLMGLNLVEACRLAEVPKTVVVGTVCAYPKHTPVPFREEDIWNGYPEETNAPYGVAKKALLVMLQAYRQQYGMNGIYLIPVNLYGPGDNFHPRNSHVIPALMTKLWQAKIRGEASVTCWGTGKVSREFLFAEDAARGIVLGMEGYDGPEPVNLGTGREYTIRETAETVAHVVGYKGEILWDSSKPDGQPRRCLDVSRAKELFGFEARLDLVHGVQRLYNWFLQQPTTPG